MIRLLLAGCATLAVATTLYAAPARHRHIPAQRRPYAPVYTATVAAAA